MLERTVMSRLNLWSLSGPYRAAIGTRSAQPSRETSLAHRRRRRRFWQQETFMARKNTRQMAQADVQSPTFNPTLCAAHLFGNWNTVELLTQQIDGAEYPEWGKYDPAGLRIVIGLNEMSVRSCSEVTDQHCADSECTIEVALPGGLSRTRMRAVIEIEVMQYLASIQLGLQLTDQLIEMGCPMAAGAIASVLNGIHQDVACLKRLLVRKLTH